MTIQFDGSTGNITTPGSVTANNFTGNFAGNIILPGTNTEVIFNDSGSANGSPGLKFDKVTNTLITGNITAGNASVSGELSTQTFFTNGDAVVNGNLTVSGNVSFFDISKIQTEDPQIVLGVGPDGSPLTVNDGKDRGVQMDYYNTAASAQQSAFMGWINSTGNMTVASNVSIVNDVVTVNELGTLEVGNVTALNLYSTAVTNTTTVYVDNNRTDVYVQNGSFTQPFKAIQTAIDFISTQPSSIRQRNWAIIIASGVYFENINLNNKGIYRISFIGLARVLVNPTTGNSLTCNADNNELQVLDINTMDFRKPVVVVGNGTENQFLDCTWRDSKFRDLTVVAINSAVATDCQFFGITTLTNIKSLYSDSAFIGASGASVITYDDTQPAPFGAGTTFSAKFFNILIGNITFNVVGTYTCLFETYDCRLGNTGDNYVIPAGLQLSLYATSLSGNWTNNGILTLRNSSSDNPVTGITPVYVGNFGGTNLSVSGTATIDTIVGNGAGITDIDATNITAGTLLSIHGGTGLSAPGTAGQMLTSNGSGWTSDYGIILSDLTLYVATTGNDTTGTGLTIGSPWATPHRAMAWLRNRTIGNGVTVTVQVAAGTYTFTQTLNLNHPQGVQIFINGTGTTGSRPLGVALQGGAAAVRGNTVATEAYNNALLVAFYNTVWQFNDCVGLQCTLGGGVTVNTVLIRGNAGDGRNHGVMCSGGDNRSSGGAINLGTTVAVHNFGGSGVYVLLAGTMGIENVTITNNGSGVMINYSGGIWAQNLTCSNNSGTGVQCDIGGGIFCGSGVVSNNALTGFKVTGCGSIVTQDSIVTNNGENGIWTQNSGVISAIRVTVTGNTGIDIQATGSGYIGYRAGSAGTFSPALNTVGNGNALIQLV